MKRILIINSNEDTMQLLKMWLERKEFTVTFTGELGEVGKLMEEFEPSLIIIDIEQREIIPAIKNHDGNIPLLLMTSYAYRGSYSDFPPDHLIQKPFTVQQLQRKVEKLMQTVAQ